MSSWPYPPKQKRSTNREEFQELASIDERSCCVICFLDVQILSGWLCDSVKNLGGSSMGLTLKESKPLEGNNFYFFFIFLYIKVHPH